MKKLISAALAVLVTTFAFAASREKVTKEFEVRDFTGLKIHHVSNVTIVKAEKCGLKIEVGAECIDFVVLSYQDNGILNIGYEKLPFKYQNSKISHMNITVYMPHLNYIDIGGASSLTTADSFTPTAEMGSFLMNCYGASKVDSLSVSAPKATINVSEASKAVVKGNYGELVANVATASKLTMSGTADDFTLKVSEASTLKSEDLKAGNVKTDVSGASKANVYAQESLDVSVASASTLTYMSPGAIKLSVQNISGTSAFRKRDLKEKK